MMKQKEIAHEYTYQDMANEASLQHQKDLEEKRKYWLSLGKDFKFDINKHVEEEKYILKVKSNDTVWDIAGAGALGVIAGPPKSRKTAILSAIEAAGVSPGKEVLGFTLDLNKNDRILSIDTEQREGSFAKVKRQVYNWAGIHSNPPNYESYNLRTLYPKDRMEFIQSHVFHGEKPKLLIIDVVTDLIYDFNDHVKSQQLVEDIMKMAGKDTLTLLSIHLGKAGLVLGHVGSALARKVDFMIEVRLDEDYYQSTVECKLSRDVPMFPDFTIRQENQPRRIFRPDLEIGQGAWSQSINLTSNIQPNRIMVEEDDVPF